MKTRKMVAILTLVIFASFSTAMAQDALKWFPKETSMFVQVDLPTVEKVIAANHIDDISEGMFDKIDFDPFEHFSKVYVGIGNDEDEVYVVMKGNLNAAALVELAKKAAREEGEEIKFRKDTVAGMPVWIGLDEGTVHVDVLTPAGKALLEGTENSQVNDTGQP